MWPRRPGRLRQTPLTAYVYMRTDGWQLFMVNIVEHLVAGVGAAGGAVDAAGGH